jgi:hypothetical protein
MLFEPGKTYIRKLRATYSGRDALALQNHLARALLLMDLHPAGLPPSAIVCIHAFRGPRPDWLRSQQNSHRSRHAWEQATAAALAQLVGKAVRPALGTVRASDEAVIFLDRSEMLACLASDWCDGCAMTQWWWQILLKDAEVARTVLREWLDQPEYIPAALARLAQSRKVKPFVNSLSAVDARSMLEAMTRSFALGELASALGIVLYRNHQVNGQSAATREPGKQESDGRISVRDAAAPWRRWAPESADGEAPLEHACLLGIGLMLARQPGIAQTPDFARAVVDWYRATITDGGEFFRKAATAPAARRRFRNHELERADRVAGADRSAEHVAQATKAFDPFADEERLPAAASGLDAKEHFASLDPAGAARMPLASGQATEESTAGQRLLASEQNQARVLEAEQWIVPAAMETSFEHAREFAPPFEAQIETELGGFFYLMNLGLFLNLYGDFTTPARPGIALSVWDFVALLGQQISGAKRQADRLGWLLAQLAGRDQQQEPGSEFNPPDAWRLAAEWLAPFSAEGVWQWQAAGKRLRLKHPEQFFVLDIPLAADDPRNQLRREVQAYAGLAGIKLQRAGFYDEGAGGSALQRWFGWLMPYARARLGRALGLTEADDLSGTLCEYHARVFVTATHLDVFFSLDQLPIEIRLSGLDRNPGWVPAAGRFIAFHFE